MISLAAGASAYFAGDYLVENRGRVVGLFTVLGFAVAYLLATME